MKPFILNRNDCRDISKGLEYSGTGGWFRGWFRRENRWLLELATLFGNVDCRYVEVRQEEVCPACKRRNE